MSIPTILEVPLNGVPRKLLELIAEAGVLGETAEEVAAYLILRELDDMTRCGLIKLGNDS